MQTALSQKAMRSAARPSRASRTGVVVQASAESRRSVLSTLFAGAALGLVQSAQAVTPVELKDQRYAREKGFDIIYEARDLSLDQDIRDGFTQARANLADTKKRVKESEARIDSELEPFIKKNYWTEGREQLRRQVGTLRFDLNTLATAKTGKEDKKKALDLKKEFIAQVEALDFALRKKDETQALNKLTSVKTSLDNVLAFVL